MSGRAVDEASLAAVAEAAAAAAVAAAGARWELNTSINGIEPYLEFKGFKGIKSCIVIVNCTRT